MNNNNNNNILWKKLKGIKWKAQEDEENYIEGKEHKEHKRKNDVRMRRGEK
jgi:hypothetical protein